VDLKNKFNETGLTKTGLTKQVWTTGLTKQIKKTG
jgi:hypothetical protein